MTELLYFTASWCVPCRSFGPVVEEFKTKNPRIKTRKIDIDEEPSTTTAFDIMSVPTVIGLQDGSEVKRFSGARTLDYLESFVGG